MIRGTRILVVIGVMVLGACGQASDAEESSVRTPESVTRQIEQIETVVRSVPLTRRNDIDELLGRKNGYKAATVFVDAKFKCAQPSVDCGAVLEVWDDPDDAASRSEYVKSLQNGMSGLGVEDHFREGGMLLRVNGNLSPAQVRAYEAAFRG